jgi:hypothetical protein
VLMDLIADGADVGAGGLRASEECHRARRWACSTRAYVGLPSI